MALDDILEYFIINNVEAIIKILIKYEMIYLNMEPRSLHSSNSLFWYTNIGFSKSMVSILTIVSIEIMLTYDNYMNTI